VTSPLRKFIEQFRATIGLGGVEMADEELLTPFQSHRDEDAHAARF
jgi:hypothetical protein